MKGEIHDDNDEWMLIFRKEFDNFGKKIRDESEKIEIDLDLLQKGKTRKRVWVKPTATKKGYYREQEVGQKEIEKKPPRKDTGKIASLPEDIKKEILDLRRLGDSGASIKSQIENMIDASDDPKIKDDLAAKGILKSSSGPASLNVTGQSLVDWTKARGVESTKKRKTVKVVEEKAKEIEEKRFKEANEKLARLQTENKMLQEQFDRERKSKMESDELRNKLNNENYILREKLKLLNKPVKETGKEVDNKKLVSQYMAGMEHASRHLKLAKIEKFAGSGRLEIEIDLGIFNKAQDEGVSTSRPGLVKKKVTVKRGGKTFQQYRWVKAGAEEPAETKPAKEPVEKPKKELVIIGLNKPEPEEEEKKPKSEVAAKVDTKDLSDRMGFYQSGLNFHPEGEKMIDAVEEYTAIDYSKINDYLRTDQSGDEEKDNQIDHISTFLKNAPKMEGTVYRGMNFWKEREDSSEKFNEFLNRVKVGGSLTLKSFTSTSTKEDVAMEFAEGGNAHTIIFDIKSKSGVYLDGVSQKKEENEVLFDKDSKFGILKVDRSGYPDHVRIIMEEI